MRVTGNQDSNLTATLQTLHDTLVDRIKDFMPDIVDRLAVSRYEIKLCNRLQITAGYAKGMRNPVCGVQVGWSKLMVSLNYRLLVDNPIELEKTYAHEFAHIVAYLAYPNEKVKHGPKWQAIMTRLGYKPEVTHNIDVSMLRRKRIRYDYACSNYACGKRFKLTSYKHNRSERYRCNLCKSQIGYIGNEE